MTAFIPTTAVSTEGARTLPQESYVSPRVFAREQAQIFGRRWLCVGREEQVARAGQYFLVNIGVESLIVVRDRAGGIRALYNVCRHRGTRLCEASQGEFSGSIQCPYHAWTYSLDGRLIGVPDQRELDGFDKADYPLIEARLQRWRGFLFVNLALDPEPFADTFGALDARVERFNLEALQAGRRFEYDVRANWKLLFQNYSECYHCSPLHPSLVKLSPPTSGENDLVAGPVLGGFMTITTTGGSMTLSGRSCGLPVADLPAEDLQRVYYYSIFPNMLLSLHHDYVMVHSFEPVAPDRTHVSCEFLFHPDTLARPEFNPDDGTGFWDVVNREDWHICEMAQAGVQSRGYRPGPYSRRESLSAAFDRHYRVAMGEQGAPG